MTDRFERIKWTPPILGWQYKLHWNKETTWHNAKTRTITWTATNWQVGDPYTPIYIECRMRPVLSVYWTVRMRIPNAIIIFGASSSSTFEQCITEFEKMVESAEGVIALARG